MNTVIVVDDDKTFTGLLKTIFELEGYRAVVLSDPDTVMETARQESPLLILMDVHIGRNDTLDVLQELKSDGTLGTVPVVMDSGMDHSSKCLAAGADAFLLKPFRPTDLLATVERLIGKKDTNV